MFSLGEPRGQPHGGSWGVPGQTWATTGLRAPGTARVPGQAGSWGREVRGAVRQWVSGLLPGPQGEEAAPPFPEAEPSTPLGSAPHTPSKREQAAHGPVAKLGTSARLSGSAWPQPLP